MCTRLILQLTTLSVYSYLEFKTEMVCQSQSYSFDFCRKMSVFSGIIPGAKRVNRENVKHQLPHFSMVLLKNMNNE